MKQAIPVLVALLVCCMPFRSKAPDFLQQHTYPYYPLFLQQETPWADSVYNSLSLEERIAQLFMVPAYSYKEKNNEAQVRELITKYRVGGLIFMQGNPTKQIQLINEYQQLSKIPLLISMDAEGGLGFRLKNTLLFPSQMTLGAIDDLMLIREIGKELAYQCKRVGVHVNFAPVADVNNNINNPVIQARSFGENRHNVADKATALALGMQSENILTVGKHFPGHGDTHIDSHKLLPLINFDYNRLDSVELFPFKQLIRNGISGMMSAHLNIPTLDRDIRVSSLSPKVVNQLLRKKLGFNGLIFTDALNMRGVADYYKNGEAELQALIAGNDVLLFSANIKKSIKKIQRAIKKGRISQEEIDEKVKRVLKAKEFVGLDRFTPVSLKNLHKDLHNRNFKLLNFRVIRDAICVAKNTQNIIPIKGIDKLKILSIGIGNKNQNTFQNTLNKYAHLSFVNIPKNAPQHTYNRAFKVAKKYDLIILSIHHTRKSDNYGINPSIKSFIEKLSKNKNVILNYFGSPYGLSRFDSFRDIDAVIVSHTNGKIYQDISAQIIFGGLGAKGKLPVTAHSELVEGTGVRTQATRVGYGMPEIVNLDYTQLQSIDEIVKNAIRKRAMPGARVLIARKGQVVFNKAYGYHTYARRKPVKKSDIYDLASVTKIVGTLPGIMKLWEDKKLKLKGKLSVHVPTLKNSDKKSITFKEVLAHQSGLKAYIPFFYMVIDTAKLGGELFLRYKKHPYVIRIYSNFYIHKNYQFKKHLFSEKRSKRYPLKLADKLYLKRNFSDTLLRSIIKQYPLLDKKYRYSDLGLILLQKVIENINQTPMDTYLETTFYKKLGCKTLSFNPLEKFSKKSIVPTSIDPILRKGLVHGKVHDHVAALAGGVSGHAGLFSNAEDLVKILQMYLNEGTYGGEKFFKRKSIRKFTAKVYKNSTNRRALGFDKPQLDTSLVSPVTHSVSPYSYGHSGFTGILAWIDPVYDLIYIFQSNRVHPNDWNQKIYKLDVRSNIHDIIYNSIIDKNECEKKFKIVEN